MPIKHAVWRVGDAPTSLPLSKLANEQQLERMIIKAPEILSGEWLLIGQQEQTGLGGRIDLLAIAPDASLVLIELKRDRTPREIVAQAIDYASWVENLTSDKIAQIYHRFSKGGNLDEAFKKRFGITLDEDALNDSHQIVLVAAELDDSTERIIGYLNRRDIAINVLFFQVFQFGEELLLSRAWLIDPAKTQSSASRSSNVKEGETKEPWNGEYYVSFGGDCTWEDARKYGFICAGGGSWYTRTLGLLSPGDRVWVNMPKTGYVGVGRVVEAVQSVEDFKIRTPEGDRLAIDVLQPPGKPRRDPEDADASEHFVRIEWLDTVDKQDAFYEVGLFGNQNTVCQPTTQKWRHTVERLKMVFKNWDGAQGAQALG